MFKQVLVFCLLACLCLAAVDYKGEIVSVKPGDEGYFWNVSSIEVTYKPGAWHERNWILEGGDMFYYDEAELSALLCGEITPPNAYIMKVTSNTPSGQLDFNVRVSRNYPGRDCVKAILKAPNAISRLLRFSQTHTATAWTNDNKNAGTFTFKISRK